MLAIYLVIHFICVTWLLLFFYDDKTDLTLLEILEVLLFAPFYVAAWLFALATATLMKLTEKFILFCVSLFLLIMSIFKR